MRRPRCVETDPRCRAHLADVSIGVLPHELDPFVAALLLNSKTTLNFITHFMPHSLLGEAELPRNRVELFPNFVEFRLQCAQFN
mmetsp:Transcript_5932/g.13020  ORF Transcript_5932/g.13020 Transcript_5932/m.13020 type:complete len:84 (-) Transcript_5932:369-620(-)